MGKFVMKELMEQHLKGVENEIETLKELDAIISQLSEDNQGTEETKKRIKELNIKLDELRVTTKDIEKQIFN